MTFYRPIVGRQSPDIGHLSPAARRTDGRSRATVPTYISSRLHYIHHILCHGVCGNVSVVVDGDKRLIVQLLEPYYLRWMRGHPRVVWSLDGRGTIEKTGSDVPYISTSHFFYYADNTTVICPKQKN